MVIWVFGFFFGFVLGFVVGGFLVEGVDWCWVFWVIVIVVCFLKFFDVDRIVNGYRVVLLLCLDILWLRRYIC